MRSLHSIHRWISSTRGLTLVEILITVAIVGVLFALGAVAVRILNGLRYQQNLVAVQTEAKPVMAQLVQDIRNADHIVLNTTILDPGLAAIVEDGDFIRIFSYDYARFGYKDGNDRDPDFLGEAVFNEVDNKGEILYGIVDERKTGKDENDNGILNEPPYLLRAERWDPFPWDNQNHPPPNCFAGQFHCDTFLTGIIQPTEDPTGFKRTFRKVANQVVHIDFYLRPRGYKVEHAGGTKYQSPEILFSAAASMRNPLPE